MSTPSAKLPETSIAILGLGLMGGSLALALQGRCRALLAADPHEETRALARRLQAVDHIAAHPAEVVARADLVILAAPVCANLQILADLPRWSRRPLMVMDVSSTKGEIVAAMQRLPSHFDPVGGHPMCGKETSGLSNAEAEMFRGEPFAFTALPRTSGQLKALALELAEALGARPLWLDAERHDHWVAATSHLPYLAAAALSASAPLEAKPLVGPGFRSATRLTNSDVTMMLDILATNRQPILQALAHFRSALDKMESALQADDLPRVRQLLTAAQEKQTHFDGA
ncbi:MAG: prephenate dehydrogenase/arogenate dehydrogenase family protein [Chloroflexi bacterium]|nr:prephenate dehydrogenase/arogenate dehydrogenase family protein [Chloroflexota bacterium]